MKKTLSFFLAFITVLLMLPRGTAYATEGVEQVEIIPLDDGAYIEVTRDSIAAIATGIVTDKLNYTYKTSDGTAEWMITLTGTFVYNGATSTCTLSNCSVEIYKSSWYVVSKSATKSGDTAYASVTMGLKFLGVTVKKHTYDLTLTCDKDGNVS